MRAKNIQVVSILASAVVTASGNGVGKDISAYEGDVKFTLDSDNGGGADHVNDVKLQHSDTLGGAYTDVVGGAFAQVTNAADAFESLIVSADGLKAFVRGVDALGGTGPSFSRALSMVGEKKYS